MDKCIDLYSRLIIATITFVGPFIIFLLSNFSAGEKRRKELAEDSIDEISKRAAQEVNNNTDNPKKNSETIHKTSKELKKIELDTKIELDKLNPTIQFWHIYGSLALSYLLLSTSYLIRDNYNSLYNHIASVIILISSTISYCYSLYRIVRVFHTIISTKKIEN